MQIHTCLQRSPEWFDLHDTVIMSASESGAFIYNEDKKSITARRRHILSRLANPLYTDDTLAGYETLRKIREKKESFFNYDPAIQRGVILEPIARDIYAKDHNVIVKEFGFLSDDDLIGGCSPDGIVMNFSGNEMIKGLEIKCPFPETHMVTMLTKEVPDEYLHQIHFSLAITGLDSWDFMSFCPGLPPFYTNVPKDATTAKIKAGLIGLQREYKKIAAELSQAFDAYTGGNGASSEELI